MYIRTIKSHHAYLYLNIFGPFSIGIRKTELTKRVNAESTVGQSSRDSALNNDNNFVT